MRNEDIELTDFVSRPAPKTHWRQVSVRLSHDMAKMFDDLEAQTGLIPSEVLKECIRLRAFVGALQKRDAKIRFSVNGSFNNEDLVTFLKLSEVSTTSDPRTKRNAG